MLNVSSIECFNNACNGVTLISQELQNGSNQLLMSLREKQHEISMEVARSNTLVMEANTKIAMIEATIASLLPLLPESAAELEAQEAQLEIAMQNLALMENRLLLSQGLEQKVMLFIESTNERLSCSNISFNNKLEELNAKLTHATNALEQYLSKSFNKESKDYTRQKSQGYEYAKLQHKQGKISIKDMEKAYIAKLEAKKDSFRESSKAETHGVKLSKYNLPEFESKYSVKIEVEDFNKTRDEHKKIANTKLKKELDSNEELKKLFSQRQIDKINMGKAPDGYVWHHDGNPPPGNLQLVEAEIHDAVRHDGGYSLWADRSE